MALDNRNKFRILGFAIGVIGVIAMSLLFSVLIVVVIWVLLQVVYKGPRDETLQFLFFGAIGAFLTFGVFFILLLLFG